MAGWGRIWNSSLLFLSRVEGGEMCEKILKNCDLQELSQVFVAYVNIYVREFCRAGRLGVFSPEKCFRRVD